METRQSPQFKKWLSRLVAATRVRIMARINNARDTGHFGDHKPLGEGLFEMRYDFAHGYRVYYGFWKEKLLLLTLGGDKSGQDEDIKRARKILAKMKQEEERLEREDRERREREERERGNSRG